MYEINGIVYAGNPLPQHKVIYAVYQGGYTIRVGFNTGEVVDVDFDDGFEGGAFKPLKDESVLKSFSIEHGALSWMNGEIDVAPEYLLSKGKAIQADALA